MKLTDQLLAEIDAFRAKAGMTETAFGLAAVNDGHLVRDLRAGKGITSLRIDRIKAYIEANRPRRKPRSRRRGGACHGHASA